MKRVRNIPSEGAFYAMFSIEGVTDTLQFCKRAVVEAKIGMAPGTSFGRGSEQYIRLCYAKSPELLHTAMDRLEAFLDLEKLPSELVVRTKRDGDRFYPLGAPGEKKLGDVLTDKKIAKERRDIPLLCAGNQVYFACGLTISEHARVTPDTREILHIICNRGTRD